MAQDLIAQDRTAKQPLIELLDSAYAALKDHGVTKQSFAATARRGKRSLAGLKGMDEVAADLMDKWPSFFDELAENPSDTLARLLEAGYPKAMSAAEARTQAQKQMAQPNTPPSKPRGGADEGVEGELGGPGPPTEVEPGVLFSGAPIQLTLLDKLISQGWSPAKAVRRWLTSAGDLPKEAFAEKQAHEGRIAAFAQDVRNTEKDLKKAVGDYSRLKPGQIEAMDAALRGDPQAIAHLPPEVRDVIGRMRDEVDTLSHALVQSGAIDGPMAATVDANLGVYLHRRYRVFDDPKWAEKVPEDVRNRFKSWMRAELERKRYDAAFNEWAKPERKRLREMGWRPGKDVPEGFETLTPPPERPQVADAELDAITRSLLYEGTAAESPIAFLSKSKLGSKDLSVVTKRKAVPPELRALWGEYNDPLINYANSVAKMSHLLSNHQFLTRVREQGLGTFLTPEPSGENIVRVAMEGSEVMKPLNGLYTTPEIKRAFEEVYKPAEQGKLLRAYMTALGLAKYAKTVGSHVTHLRNFFGNTGFAVANGHLGVNKAIPALKAMVSETPEGRVYYRRLLELGVVGDSIHAGEFKDVVRDILGQKETSAVEVMGMVSDRRILSWVRKGGKLAEKVYQAEDAVWKTYGFENEKARYAKAYPDWTTEQVEQKAAEIVRDTYPTYSLTPRATKLARRLPLVAPFVSFPSEVVRTTFKTMQLAAAELKAPETKAIGAQRLAGLAVALTASAGLAATTRAMFGMDKEDEDAMRRFLPEWSKDAPLLHLGGDPGKYRYIDLASTDPHGYLVEPFLALLRGEDPTRALRRPFFAEELVTERALDTARNTKRQGGEVYNPQAAPLDKLKAVGQHMGGPFVPGSYESGRRLTSALTGTPDPKTGRIYSVADEATSNLTGQRVAQIDVAQSLQYRARSFNSGRSDAVQLLTVVARGKGLVSDEDLIAAKAKMEQARRALYESLRQDALAAQTLGISKTEVSKTLRTSGVSLQDVNDVLAGRYRPYQVDDEQAKKWGLPAAERQRRLQVIRKASASP